MRGLIGFGMVTFTVVLTATMGCGSSTPGTGGSGGGTSSSTAASSPRRGSGGEGGGDGLPEGKCRKGWIARTARSACSPARRIRAAPASAARTSAGATPSARGRVRRRSASLCRARALGRSTAWTGAPRTRTATSARSGGADHRCTPSECAQQLDCPTNFLCPPVAQSKCERRKCTVDPSATWATASRGLATTSRATASCRSRDDEGSRVEPRRLSRLASLRSVRRRPSPTSSRASCAGLLAEGLLAGLLPLRLGVGVLALQLFTHLAAEMLAQLLDVLGLVLGHDAVGADLVDRRVQLA